MACAFGANLMMTCYGLVVPASAFMIPQLEDPDSGFGISLDEGSWLGMYFQEKKWLLTQNSLSSLT